MYVFVINNEDVDQTLQVHMLINTFLIDMQCTSVVFFTNTTVRLLLSRNHSKCRLVESKSKCHCTQYDNNVESQKDRSFAFPSTMSDWH